jgi:hypothetical protein
VKRVVGIDLLLVFLLVSSQASCGSNGGGEPRIAWPTAGWSVEPPEQHGMDSAVLDGARQYAFQPEKHTQGVVVVRHGVIVAEWYEDGRDAASLLGRFEADC